MRRKDTKMKTDSTTDKKPTGWHGKYFFCLGGCGTIIMNPERIETGYCRLCTPLTRDDVNDERDDDVRKTSDRN